MQFDLYGIKSPELGSTDPDTLEPFSLVCSFFHILAARRFVRRLAEMVVTEK